MRLKPEGLDLPQQIFIRIELVTPSIFIFLVGYGEQVSERTKRGGLLRIIDL